MIQYSVKPRTGKYVKAYGFLSFARNLSNEYGTQLLDTGLNVFKTASKKVIPKAAEVISEFTGNKITDKIVKPKAVPSEKLKYIEEIITPAENREEILNK